MIVRSKLIDTEGGVFDPAAYEVTVRPLQAVEGGGWLATIPTLPGCVGDGETEMDAIQDVRLAALEWAEAAMKDGDPIPAPSHRNPMAAE
ncbi:type II toxin-antitoxin system HicB family antitoxin [Arvimicrobium flavum]|uniref:type II toxin-antitoxin system HicB family antitoxin n=1 Tax=Arvimicrobium flavum TaxID=3393320 RepID=UPI00237B52A5|nr:type II toxin-antitoxin system HicB family antitoxin [Mesorhizobium shangrilense]